MSYKRQFSSGSRQAPDPFDQYLDEAGFYRKHTARDSSSLFRVISEQLYDTQQYHDVIREHCVSYMLEYKNYFQETPDMDMDQYLLQLSRPRTYGSLLELRAMAYNYERNVLLFEAYNVGTWLVHEPNFKYCFRVFHTPEKHFDSVFKKPYIEDAAFCQSLIYEILYSNVFKLPDVIYAVERMLHDPIDGSIKTTVIKSEFDNYPDRICLSDGRSFHLSKPYNTECILDNFRLCHFHNGGFEQLAMALQNEKSEFNEYQDTSKINRMIDSLLPDKYSSCVRQILDEGITPFPYKVAKALDPDIYRNIEFDSWSELRKEMRMQSWYIGDNVLQVGVKCLVKLHKSQQNLYNCHIQDMEPGNGPCIVFVHELGEKHTVPYTFLNPLPKDQMPSKYQQFNKNCSTYSYPNDLNKKNRPFKRKYTKQMKNVISYNCKTDKFTKEIINTKNDVTCKLERFTSFSHYQPASFDIMAMPIFVNGNGNNRQPGNKNNNNADNHSNNKIPNTPQNDVKPDVAKLADDTDFETSQNSLDLSYSQYPSNSPFYIYSGYNMNEHVYQHPSYEMPTSSHLGTYMNSSNSLPSNCSSSQYAYASRDISNMVPVPGLSPINSSGGGGSYYNTSIYPSPGYYPTYNTGTLLTIRRPDLLQSPFPVNLNAKPSYSSTGSDMPVCDLATTRFFYNLGHEYFVKLQSKFSIQTLHSLTLLSEDHRVEHTNVASISENDMMHNLTSELSNMKFDKDSNQINKNENNNRRYNYARLNNKKDKNSRNQQGANSKHSNNKNKEPTHLSPSKDINAPTNAEQQSLNDPPQMRENRQNVYNGHDMGPYIHMSTPYPYIPYYNNIEQQSMYVAPISYGMLQSPGYPFSYSPSMHPSIPPPPPPPPHSVENSTNDSMESQYSYFYPQTSYIYPPPQPVAAAPQGFWYPPPPIPQPPSNAPPQPFGKFSNTGTPNQ